MAIGDSFSVFMGTGTTNRQPSAGVFEEVSSVVTAGPNDAVILYDGSNSAEVFEGSVLTARVHGDAAAVRLNPYNMAIKIGNTIYLRKSGTSDRMAASGVQVDA